MKFSILEIFFSVSRIETTGYGYWWLHHKFNSSLRHLCTVAYSVHMYSAVFSLKNAFIQCENSASRQSWVGEVECEESPSISSVCGLEISFSSIPQDIDIKLIPGNQNCNINNAGKQSQKFDILKSYTISDNIPVS